MDTTVANEARLQSSPEETDGFPLRHLSHSHAKGLSDDAADNIICLVFFLFAFSIFNKTVPVLKTLM